jgi:hypothetical protein
MDALSYERGQRRADRRMRDRRTKRDRWRKRRGEMMARMALRSGATAVALLGSWALGVAADADVGRVPEPATTGQTSPSETRERLPDLLIRGQLKLTPEERQRIRQSRADECRGAADSASVCARRRHDESTGIEIDPAAPGSAAGLGGRSAASLCETEGRHHSDRRRRGAGSRDDWPR